MDRRSFIRNAGIAAMAGAATHRIHGAQRTSPNDEVVMAVVGINGQGRSHFNDFCAIPGVRIKTVCDVDERLIPRVQEMATKLTGKQVKFETDVRRVLEDKEIDAISVATPNHCHSLIAIWA